MMKNCQIPDFRGFCDSRFHLSARLGLVRDGRLQPEISASTVCLAIVFLGALGLPSLLRCDQMLRTPLGRRWFRRPKGESASIVSDSTMQRSLQGLDLAPARALLQSSYRFGKTLGLSKCPLRRHSLRLGLVDGSDFGGFLASCLQIIGQESFIVDLEPIQKRGKELPSSYALLRRTHQTFGTGFVDVMMADALYLNAPFFNLCLHQCHTDVLVKSREADRKIIVDAMGLFQHADSFPEGIIRIDGVDVDRLRTYVVLCGDGFQMPDVDVPLQVAWVREEELNSGKRHEFWVVASSEYLCRPLNGEEMRELAHWRWDEENNGFKAANQRVNTKRLYCHDRHAKTAILLLLFLVFNLLSVYLWQCQSGLNRYPGMKRTRVFFEQLVRFVFIAAAFSDDGG